MSLELVLAILAGWLILPAFAWALAHEVLRFIIYLERHQAHVGPGSDRFHLRQFRQVQR
jgi:hypothetical protein